MQSIEKVKKFRDSSTFLVFGVALTATTAFVTLTSRHTRHADITPHGSFRTWLLPLAGNSAYRHIYIYLACACCQASLPHTRIYHIIWPQLACFRIKVALLLIHFTSPCLRGSNERCRRRDSGRHCSHKNCMRIHATPSTALTIRSLTLAFLPALSILLLSLCDYTAQVLLAFQIVQSTQKYLITKVIAFRSITHVCLCVCERVYGHYLSVCVGVILDLPAAIDLRNYCRKAIIHVNMYIQKAHTHMCRHTPAGVYKLEHCYYLFELWQKLLANTKYRL